jgi:hypothetical protein
MSPATSTLMMSSPTARDPSLIHAFRSGVST